MQTAMIGLFCAVVGSIITWILKGFIQKNILQKKQSKDLFVESLIKFMEKSKLPEVAWTDKNADDELRKAVQLIHLVPIYKEFHNTLVSRPTLDDLSFKEPQSNLDFHAAEIRTICHVSKLLWDSGVFDPSQIKPAAYLFNDDNKTELYDFPANYWV